MRGNLDTLEKGALEEALKEKKKAKVWYKNNTYKKFTEST